MKILLCHNFYQQPGGEDRVFADEGSLLEAAGHEVVRYVRHNDDIKEMGKLDLLRKTIWNPDTVLELRQLIEAERPDVMHCTNTFPLISPAAYHAAGQQGVAVVQSLHNYRLICPKAVFVRDGSVCEKCLGRQVAWPALVHKCYRDSRAASAAVVAMLAYHWKKRTWTTAVDRFIALTRFAKQKLVQGGLPEDRITVKPNFVTPDPGAGDGRGQFAIFVGRLSAEKGVDSLLRAWQSLSADLELKILGDGPLADAVSAAAAKDRRINWLGHRSRDQVLELLGAAQFLVMPSVCYETFGLSMIEAYARGTPVIASRQGAMAEIVRENKTGWLFEPGNSTALAETVQQAIQSPGQLLQMRADARREYLDHYSPDQNYRQLIDIYRLAIESRTRPSGLEPDPNLAHQEGYRVCHHS